MQNIISDLFKRGGKATTPWDKTAPGIDRVYMGLHMVAESYISGDINNVYRAWNETILAMEVLGSENDKELDRYADRAAEPLREEIKYLESENKRLEERIDELNGDVNQAKKEYFEAEDRENEIGAKYERLVRSMNRNIVDGDLLRAVLDGAGC